MPPFYGRIQRRRGLERLSEIGWVEARDEGGGVCGVERQRFGALLVFQIHIRLRLSRTMDHFE